MISQRVGHEAALAYIDEIKLPESVFTICWITEALEAQALHIFAQQISKNVSLVDCTNMALMKQQQLDYIFSFDATYSKNGFPTIQQFVSI